MKSFDEVYEFMSIGLILLIAVAILVMFGVAQRVLDKLRLTDRQAILFTALIFIGGLIPDIQVTNLFRFNIGGCLVPLALCVFLLIKADTAWETWRALIASVLTGAAVFFLGRLLPNEPDAMGFDPNYIYGIAAGLLAFVFGGSRRGAFVAAVLGVLLADTAQAIINWNTGIMQPLTLGGAGALDAVILSGLIAVLLTELIGELLERATRGTHRDEDREFEDGEFVRREKRK